MAVLIGPEQCSIYLNYHHTIGRLPDKVDTLINEPFVSRVHTLLQWQSNNWQLRDMSRNGTWLNGERLGHNQPAPINTNDTLQFGSPNAAIYEVVDDSPPSDALIHWQPEFQDIPFVYYLEDYQFLPDSDSPELVLYKKNNIWLAEKLEPAQQIVTEISDKDTVYFDAKQWQLRLVDQNNMTMMVEHCAAEPEDTQLLFNLSQDEEHCHLTIKFKGEKISLDSRSHHLLTLNLARYRVADKQSTVHEDEQGWVYIQQLSKDLGLEERHINIQIHRARKQISDTFGKELECSHFIERRLGQVRLGFPFFEINKGGQIEASTCPQERL